MLLRQLGNAGRAHTSARGLSHITPAVSFAGSQPVGCLLSSSPLLVQRTCFSSSVVHLQKKTGKMALPRVYMDIEADGARLGRITMEVSYQITIREIVHDEGTSFTMKGYLVRWGKFLHDGGILYDEGGLVLSGVSSRIRSTLHDEGTSLRCWKQR